MTPREMATRYLATLGRKMQGDSGELAPIMPILILDLQYQIYTHNFTKKILRAKGYKNKVIEWCSNWKRAYDKINKPFFNVFSEEEQDEVTGIMDKLAEYTNNTLVQLRCAYRKLLAESGNKELDTDLLTCNLLIKLAQSYYEEVYYGRGGKVGSNDIDALLNAQTTFMNIISANKIEIYMDNCPDVNICIKKLCREVVDFCFEQD